MTRPQAFNGWQRLVLKKTKGNKGDIPMMNFNVNAIFQAQISQIASFFEAPKRRFTSGTTESKERARLKADEFVSTHPILDVEEVATDNDAQQHQTNPYIFSFLKKDGWR